MRITCDVIQDLMPSYVDGILSEDSRALVEEHMGTCQECRKMLEIMSRRNVIPTISRINGEDVRTLCC